MTYRAPINDMLLALNHGAGLQAALKAGHYGDFDADMTAAVLEEAGRFASDVLAPLNTVGDKNGIKLSDIKSPPPPAGPMPMRAGLPPAGTASPAPKPSAARACRWRSMPPAPKSGARRTSPSASARC